MTVKVALVGPCGVGKSTVARLLREEGYVVAEPAQEHSGVPDMWARLTRPDVLIVLDASLATLRRHRPTHDYAAAELDTWARRLAHARAHADLLLTVDDEAPRATARRILAYLGLRAGTDHAPEVRGVDPPFSRPL